MSPEHEALRSTAAGLRLKAHTGLAATAAARDLVHILACSLERVVDTDLDSGALKTRWEKALADARAGLDGVDCPEEDVYLAALSDVLAWHQKRAVAIAQAYLEKIEAARSVLEGRAAGIEEALGVLSAE